MRNNRTRWWLHVLGALAFLSLPLVLAPGPVEWHTLHMPRTRSELLMHFLLIEFFYLHFFILIPRFYFQKRYRYYIFLLIICFIIMIVASQLIQLTVEPFHTGPGGPPGLFDLFEVSYDLFLFLVVTFISLTIRVNERWQQTEQEKTDAELSFLKAQINPHFLFNTLNSIYSLAIQKSDETAAAVVKLSDMMRYVTGEAHHDFVPLAKENHYIHNYIDLQKIRLDGTVQLQYQVIGDPSGKQIAPLLLIPFVENAFKHGVNPEEDSKIDIDIYITTETLTLQVYNKKVQVQQQQEAKSGLGIENTRHRLQLLYPNLHELMIEETEKDFSVLLHIQLNKDLPNL
jgi:sensor histidine kinase YesM